MVEVEFQPENLAFAVAVEAQTPTVVRTALPE